MTDRHTSAAPVPAHGERVLYVVFVALIVLLAVTVVVSWFPLGAWNLPVAIAIAGVKAALILLYFMDVRHSRPLIWLVAGAAFFWLAILIGLTLADYHTRMP